MSAVSSTVIPCDLTLFIKLSTAMNKMCSMLKNDGLRTDIKIQAVCKFQELLNIRMEIVSRLCSDENVKACESLKNQLDVILDDIKELVSKKDKDKVLRKLKLVKFYMKNLPWLSFDYLKHVASEQIETVDADILKLLVSAAIYIEKITVLYEKYQDNHRIDTLNAIRSLFDNYYKLIKQRSELVKLASLENIFANFVEDQSEFDGYIKQMDEIHEYMINVHSFGECSSNTFMMYISKLINTYFPKCLRTDSMVILAKNIVDATEHSLY